MTSAQIQRVLKLYETKLAELLASNHWKGRSKEYGDLRYLQDMIPRFPDTVKEREKAMRWLCFMQGVFWSYGVYSVGEFREHNATKATKTEVARLYHNHSLRQHVPCAACGDLDGCHKWGEYEGAANG